MSNSNRYVALSYVWGQVDTYRLVKGNLKGLMKFDGLTRIWENLPRTIRDVILFTEAIGERYLWVDTLCLIQDDDNDKMPGIKHMDVIYSRALCTIIAASGKDADAGIPGWGLIRRRAQQISEVLPRINLILTKGMSTYLKQTVYDTRAWTFQEYFLCPRRIIFANSQAFYVCRERHWREDEADRINLSSDEWVDESYLSLLNGWWMNDNFDTHDMWTMMLFHYTKRELTYESDILNATAGICRVLSIPCKCSFFQGMPVVALDLYLLFEIAGVKSIERRCGFPSYSWTGWRGQTWFRDPFPVETAIQSKNYWLSNHTWIVWYKHEPLTGEVSLVWDIDQNPAFLEATEDDIGYRSRRVFRPNSAVTRLSGNIETTKPSQRYHNIDHTQYSYPLLQFWTVTVYLKASISKKHGIGRFTGVVLDVFDRNDDYCGCLYEQTASRDIRMGNLEPLELILLSDCSKYSERNLFPEIREHVRENSPVEKYDRDFEGKLLFWALWIRWNGDIAERAGIAQIFHASIEESLEPGPVWKEILMG